jgi:hypothetical protein
MLAFLVDQVEQFTSSLFQKAWAVTVTKISLWERMKSLFDIMIFNSRTEILTAIAY